MTCMIQQKATQQAWVIVFVLCEFPSTLLIVMLITWVVRRRLTEEGGFFRVESGSSAMDVRLLSIWRFVLEPEKYINIKLPTQARKYYVQTNFTHIYSSSTTC